MGVADFFLKFVYFLGSVFYSAVILLGPGAFGYVVFKGLAKANDRKHTVLIGVAGVVFIYFLWYTFLVFF